MYICYIYIIYISICTYPHIISPSHRTMWYRLKNSIRSSGYEVNGGDFKRLQALALKASSSNAAEFQQEWMGVVQSGRHAMN